MECRKENCELIYIDSNHKMLMAAWDAYHLSWKMFSDTLDEQDLPAEKQAYQEAKREF